MNDSSLILDGVQLMLVGMGMVFVFLSVLVLCTSFMQKIFKAEQSSISLTPSTTPSITDEEVAVISAAVHKFRSNKP